MKLRISQTYTWPVIVSMPADGGRYERQEFTAEFLRLPTSEFEKIQGEINDGAVTDRMLAERVLRGWEKVQDADGAELPFTTDNRDTLLEIPGAVRGIVAAFFESQSGKAPNGAARKN